jgi:hydrogenase expression/formation protein HypD
MEVVTLALQQQKPVVFFAVGFETTMAPVAAMMHAGVPGNLFVFTSGRRTWPAVAALLKNNNSGFDAMVCPGHVATIMGADEWGFVPQQYGKPAAIAGFTAERLLAATYVVLKQRLDGEARLVNSYDQLVTGGGNPTAQRIINDVFAIADVPWRGMGTLPDSGYVLQPAWQAHDARLRFAETLRHGGARRREGQMPPGCACGEVVSGQKYPTQCTLYGRPCTPQNPVGPCMVSDEGACQIWWKAGLHKQKHLYA